MEPTWPVWVLSSPHVTFDNERLYFIWLHPLPPGEPDLPAYFFVERAQDGWSEPEYAGQGMFLSSSRDGLLYTTDLSSRNANGRTYLVRLGTVDGRFTEYASPAGMCDNP